MYVDVQTTSPHVGEYLIGEENFRAAIENGDLQMKSLDGVKIVN
jgi:hypothetical protein